MLALASRFARTGHFAACSKLVPCLQKPGEEIAISRYSSGEDCWVPTTIHSISPIFVSTMIPGCVLSAEIERWGIRGTVDLTKSKWCLASSGAHASIGQPANPSTPSRPASGAHASAHAAGAG